MKPVRIELNSKGIETILRSEKVRADLERRAQAIADAAGGEPEDYAVSSQIGDSRARASVAAVTYASRKAEAVDRTLSTAIEAGRG